MRQNNSLESNKTPDNTGDDLEAMLNYLHISGEITREELIQEKVRLDKGREEHIAVNSTGITIDTKAVQAGLEELDIVGKHISEETKRKILLAANSTIISKELENRKRVEQKLFWNILFRNAQRDFVALSLAGALVGVPSTGLNYIYQRFWSPQAQLIHKQNLDRLISQRTLTTQPSSFTYKKWNIAVAEEISMDDLIPVGEPIFENSKSDSLYLTFPLHKVDGWFDPKLETAIELKKTKDAKGNSILEINPYTGSESYERWFLTESVKEGFGERYKFLKLTFHDLTTSQQDEMYLLVTSFDLVNQPDLIVQRFEKVK